MSAASSVTKYYEEVVRWFERLLAIFIFFGLILFIVSYAQKFLNSNWQDIGTYEHMVHVVLSMIIGLEAVRLLTTHSLESVLELLAFVVARKALEPNATSVDLVLVVAAFTVLIAGRYTLRCLIPKYKTGDTP